MSTERIAIFADLHSNLEALEACLSHAQDHGVKRYVFLGDIVGYNANPCEVINRVADIVHANQGIAVRGNHDTACYEDYSKRMNPIANFAIEWTKARLETPHLSFLQNLPLLVNEEDQCYAHASAYQPAEWQYVSDGMAAWRCADASKKIYTFVGHVHEQALYFQSSVGKLIRFAPHAGDDVPAGRHRRWVAVAGSLGQPRDGSPKANYILFDPSNEVINFQRVTYDHLKAAQKVVSAGLPQELADRLISGK